MNPRTECACQPVAFMIWASVAPPFHWSMPRTSAFLLPSRAAAGLLAALPSFPLEALVGAFAEDLEPFAFLACFAACLAFLARFGTAVADALVGSDVSAALPPSGLWIAFQIRATADFRFVNFLTGVRPGIPFQTSISRLASQVAARSASSSWLAKASPSPASCSLPCAVMLFSWSIVYVFIFAFLCAACCGHGIHHSGRRSKQVNSELILK